MRNRLDDCLILHCARIDRCEAVVDKRFDGYCSLQYMTEGAIDLSYNSRAWKLRGRQFWPCFPGPMIRFKVASGTRSWAHRYIAVRGPLLDEWRASGLWPTEPQPAPPDETLNERFDHMLAWAKDNDAGHRRRAINALEGILLILAEHREKESEGWVVRAQEELTDADVFSPDVDAIARRCGLPPSTFRRRFKAAAGLSPRDFILVHRLHRARELLTTTAKPIAEIADMLGYNDVFYFSRQFAKHIGIAPLAYRRSRLA